MNRRNAAAILAAAFLVEGGCRYTAGMRNLLPFPAVTGEQMAAVDKAMVEVCGLDLLQVMEVAGRGAALRARQLADRCEPGQEPIAVLCGSGGNGADAMVCARYLTGWHWTSELWLSQPSQTYRGLAAHQLQICRRLGIVTHEPDDARFTDSGTKMFVDGLFGFGLSAPITGRANEMIRWANSSAGPTISIDLPSGIHATTGDVLGVAIEAQETVTLGLPKVGLRRGEGPRHAGSVTVADIGVPAAAYRAVGIPSTPLFWDAEFVDLEDREIVTVPE
jgi:NAD(P)H-hydrate epimerase